MSFTRDVDKYPVFFWDLVRSFPTGPDSIELKFASLTKANHLRLRFYAFVRALEIKADKYRKKGRVGEAAQLESLAKLASSRVCRVISDVSLTDMTSSAPLPPTLVQFNVRDSEPLFADLNRQLREMNIKPIAENLPPIDHAAEDLLKLTEEDYEKYGIESDED